MCASFYRIFYNIVKQLSYLVYNMRLKYIVKQPNHTVPFAFKEAGTNALQAKEAAVSLPEFDSKYMSTQVMGSARNIPGSAAGYA